MSRFLVSQSCRDLGLRAGALLVRNLHIEDASPELRSDIDDQARRIRREFGSPAKIRLLPELAGFRNIIRRVGVKPRSHPPSTQKLLEFAWKHGTLPAVNNLVDAYNLVSLRTRCSLGAHDLDCITLPVELRLFEGTENFRPLGGDEDKPIRRGEFGYLDARERVICRLDSLQADFSKVTGNTSSALLIIESTDSHGVEQLESAFKDTLAAVARYCHVNAEILAFPD